MRVLFAALTATVVMASSPAFAQDPQQPPPEVAPPPAAVVYVPVPYFVPYVVYVPVVPQAAHHVHPPQFVNVPPPASQGIFTLAPATGMFAGRPATGIFVNPHAR